MITRLFTCIVTLADHVSVFIPATKKANTYQMCSRDYLPVYVDFTSSQIPNSVYLFI